MLRRDFLKLSATASAVTCVTACGNKGSSQTATPEKPVAAENINWTSCTCNCQAACPIKVYSRDGVAVRLETDIGPDNSDFDMRSMACSRGRASRQKVYASERLKVPMKRVGKRGEGLFEEISWDEAYQMIADNLTNVIEKYGNEAIFWPKSSGKREASVMHGGWIRRLLNLMGGFVDFYGSYSNAQIREAMALMHGSLRYAFLDGRPSEVKNSDLVLAFGFNPVENRQSGIGHGWEHVHYGKDTPTILVDPRYSDTALGKEDTWLPIRPGTDAALVEAIIYELIHLNRIDDAWVDKYCCGWTSASLPKDAPHNGDLKSYILGLGPDGVIKTPARAAKITGIPEDKIIETARRLSEAERPFICQGYGAQRHANGEQTVRSILTLPWLLGKLGKPGANSGGWPMFGGSFSNVKSLWRFPEGENKVKTIVSVFKWLDTIKDGPSQTALKDGVRGKDRLETSFKFVWNYAGNVLINQHSDVLGTKKILEDESLLEFFIVQDYAMTPTAMFADLLLPDVVDMEVFDIVSNAGSHQETMTLMSSSLKPFYKTKNVFEVCSGVAEKLGIKEQLTEGLTYEQWVRKLFDETAARFPKRPSWEELNKKGVVTIPKDNSPFPFEEYIADPEDKKLPTPSGKIEIYSSILAERAKTWELPEGDKITALPEYVVTWEGYEDEDTRYDYPLQLIGYHTKGRVHSSFHNIPWLREANEDAVWINPLDAEQRGIVSGDQVIVRSKRGKVLIPAKITPRIRPGVAAIAEGAWSKHDGDTDIGGNINTLTKFHASPVAKGNPQHTNRVEISLA